MAEELTMGVRAKAAEEFAARGVTLTSVYVEYLGPTEETAKAIDERAAIGALGDMNAYMKFQAARAMRDAAQQPGGGGTTGAGLGLGAGVGMGTAMAQMMAQAMQPGQQQAPAASATPTTAAEIQATLDNLDMRLAAGEISEATYNKLYAKWEARLKELGG
jgi:membrane protease subunit (stomatin/prohibitin family)